MWLGYALVACCLIAFGMISIHTVNSAVAAKERIIAADAEHVLEVERLRLVSETLSRKTRSYHLTRNPELSERVGRRSPPIWSSACRGSKPA